MSLFERAVERIVYNKTRQHNYIPIQFTKLQTYLPGILKRHFYIVTASSGVGKTMLTDQLFVYDAFDYCKSNGVKLKIFYYSLELSKEIKILQVTCNRLYKKYGIKTNVLQLQNIGINPITDDIIDKIKEDSAYYKEFENVITYHDDTINPYGIYKELYDYADKHGTINTEPITIFDHKDGIKIAKPAKKFLNYTPNDPEEFVICIVDHVSLINTERDYITTHLAIGRLSRNLVEIRNKFGYTVVLVQQQAAEKEKLQYTFKGSVVESKMEPSLDGLADNKMTQRDCDVAIGLFDPSRFDIETYRGHNITEYGTNFRALSVLKNRFGTPGVHLGLHVTPEAGLFRQI